MPPFTHCFRSNLGKSSITFPSLSQPIVGVAYVYQLVYFPFYPSIFKKRLNAPISTCRLVGNANCQTNWMETLFICSNVDFSQFSDFPAAPSAILLILLQLGPNRREPKSQKVNKTINVIARIPRKHSFFSLF